MALGIGLYLYLFSSVKQWNLIGFFWICSMSLLTYWSPPIFMLVRKYRGQLASASGNDD